MEMVEKMKGHACFHNKICHRSQFQEKVVKINLGGCCSAVKSCLTLCNSVVYGEPSSPVLHYLPSLLRFMSNEWLMLCNHLIFCCPFLLRIKWSKTLESLSKFYSSEKKLELLDLCFKYNGES